MRGSGWFVSSAHVCYNDRSLGAVCQAEAATKVVGCPGRERNDHIIIAPPHEIAGSGYRSLRHLCLILLGRRTGSDSKPLPIGSSAASPR